MLIHCSAFVFTQLLAHTLTLVLKVIIAPESKCALKQVLAVLLQAHSISSFLRALIIINDLVKFLLQLKASCVHLGKSQTFLLLFAEMAIDV